MKYIFLIKPCRAPRMSRQDKWMARPAVVQFRDFGRELRRQAEGMHFTMPFVGVSINFYIPMPDSWSKKKRLLMNNTYHQQTPDLDNLYKGFTDAIFYNALLKGTNKKQELTDCKIARLTGLAKYWCLPGEERIEVCTED